MSAATPIAIAVVEHEGKFLVGQRPPGVPLAGFWEFPGGKIKPPESIEAAAVRECLEEAGMVVEPMFAYPVSLHKYQHGAVELHFIACRIVQRQGHSPRPPFCWIRRDELANYQFPEGNRRLLQLLVEAADSSARPQT